MVRRSIVLAVLGAAFFLTFRQSDPELVVIPSSPELECLRSGECRTLADVRDLKCARTGECAAIELEVDEAGAAIVFNGGRPTEVSAGTTPALASTTAFTTGVCAVEFLNRTTTALHFAPLLVMNDAASVTTSNSKTVCSGGTCDHEDWAHIPAANSTLGYRSASGSISIVIIYWRCNQ